MRYTTKYITKSEAQKFLKEHIIRVDTAEADDIIATLCNEFGNTSEKIIIISGDKDMVQLMVYDNVTIYQPVKNVLIKRKD